MILYCSYTFWFDILSIYIFCNIDLIVLSQLCQVICFVPSRMRIWSICLMVVWLLYKILSFYSAVKCVFFHIVRCRLSVICILFSILCITSKVRSLLLPCDDNSHILNDITWLVFLPYNLHHTGSFTIVIKFVFVLYYTYFILYKKLIQQLIEHFQSVVNIIIYITYNSYMIVI